MTLDTRGAAAVGHGAKLRDAETYSTEEWLALRRRGIGGSDAPTILGINPYKGWLALYVEKKDLGLDPREPGEAAYWGQVLEEQVAREFERRSGFRVVEPEPRDRLIVHRELNWMLGTPDRYFHDPRTGQRLGILECKTTNERRSDEWEDGLAPYAHAQLQHYLEVADLDWGWVAVLIGGQRFRMYEVKRDPDFIAHLMAEEAKFWRHVESDDPPPPDGRDSTTSIINSRFSTAVRDSSVELTGEAAEAAVRLREMTRAERIAADEVERLKNVVRLALGDREVGTISDEVVVSWRTQTTTRVDTKRLRREQPEVAAEYVMETTSRVLRTHNRRRPGDPAYLSDED